MGSFHTFGALQQIDGVKKLVKFKQSILCQVAVRNGIIAEKHFKIVQGGACAALTMLWTYLSLKDMKFFARGSGVLAADKNLAAVKYAYPRSSATFRKKRTARISPSVSSLTFPPKATGRRPSPRR